MEKLAIAVPMLQHDGSEIVSFKTYVYAIDISLIHCGFIFLCLDSLSFCFHPREVFVHSAHYRAKLGVLLQLAIFLPI